MTLRMTGATAALATGLALLWVPAAVHAEPDEEALGKSLGYPVGRTGSESRSMPYRVGSWSALDKVPGVLTNPVRKPDTALPLPRAAQPAGIRYRHRNMGYTLDDYLERRRITSLLILKDGEIIAERYRYSRKEDARFLSFSMAKSVTALLMGAALERGMIASLDDPAGKYAKDLAGSPYGETSIRHLLRMSSGLTFTERYDGNDDVARLSTAVATGNPRVPTVLRGITDRHSAPGARFIYASAETEVLGRVLTAASGRTMAELTAEWLWQPIGAEFDAFWCTARDRQEAAYYCFNAALRDWGRLGLLLARDGKVGERQVISREYLLDATDPARQPAAFAPYKATSYFGYGYQFWLQPLKARTFAMQGVHGQTLYVQPSSGIVMVQTAVYAQASGAQDPDPFVERTAFWMGVLHSLGGDTSGY
ncbi:MAG: 6-aminohexanoate-dimer hydrolase [Pseudomonadota bacterium]|jgi:CubicO group peptidase (beta-lactamase class C family)